jgi:hypothetical protein
LGEAVIRATILREYVSDRAKAHRLNAHCRCYIQTKTGKMVSRFSPGLQPGVRYILASMEREARNERAAVAMNAALCCIGQEVRALCEEGIIGGVLVQRILGEAKQILDEGTAYAR